MILSQNKNEPHTNHANPFSTSGVSRIQKNLQPHSDSPFFRFVPDFRPVHFRSAPCRSRVRSLECFCASIPAASRSARGRSGRPSTQFDLSITVGRRNSGRRARCRCNTGPIRVCSSDDGEARDLAASASGSGPWPINFYDREECERGSGGRGGGEGGAKGGRRTRVV